LAEYDIIILGLHTLFNLFGDLKEHLLGQLKVGKMVFAG
jgi:hypothetical protein